MTMPTPESFNPSTGLSVFQTRRRGALRQLAQGFNPSTGLSVFQTTISEAYVRWQKSFNPSTGLSVFQTGLCGQDRRAARDVSIPRLG